MEERVNPIVEICGVSKHFGKVIALQDINLSVYKGEFLTLLGPSGCGKTTLLRIIAGFENPTTGRVFINGEDVTSLPPERRPLNMVFQRYALFPHLTVAENIAFGLRIKRLPEREIRDRIAQILTLVRLEGFEKRMPHQLSGGQCQRVALARALVNQPQVLLLDEPLAALDRKVRQQMQEELRIIQNRVKTTFIYVTHDQEEAMAMSSRIVLMLAGKIVQVGSPSQIYHKPASEFVADFIGDINILEGQVIIESHCCGIHWCGTIIPVRLDPNIYTTGQQVRFLVRPEAFIIWDTPPAKETTLIPAEIVRSTFCGFYWVYHLQINDTQVVVRELGEKNARQPGSKCFISVDTSQVIVLHNSQRGAGV